MRIPGGKIFQAGQTVQAGTMLPAGTIAAAGSVLPFSISINGVTWPAGAILSDFTGSISLASNITLMNPGALIPTATNLVFPAGTPSLTIPPPTTSGIQAPVFAPDHLSSPSS